MTRPLSNDLRQRVVAAVADGMSRRAAAERFGIGASTAIKWVQQWRKTGSFLPPYSPDFNPIEMAFSKFKAFLKGIAARTVNDLWDAIAQAVDIFTPNECRNFFTAAGYEPE